jgi:hypothetical protein
MGATESRLGQRCLFDSVKLDKSKTPVLSVHFLGQSDLLQVSKLTKQLLNLVFGCLEGKVFYQQFSALQLLLLYLLFQGLQVLCTLNLFSRKTQTQFVSVD